MYFGLERWKEFIASAGVYLLLETGKLMVLTIDKNLIFLEYLLWPDQSAVSGIIESLLIGFQYLK